MSKSVTIVMAVYNPDVAWLKDQLSSIDSQDYNNLDLIAVDDASNKIPHNELSDVFSSCLKKVPYKLLRNDINRGSDRTFEMLTEMAEGEYISYCDQDDIWNPEKTKTLAASLELPDTKLVYSDLSVINEDGLHIAGSLCDVRRRLKHYEGGGLAERLLFRNFTNGTAMMADARTAKAAIPFVKNMVADHWLTLWCAANGSVAYIPRPLVKYRLHGNNQSAVMSGVHDKASYLNKRIIPGLSRFEQFEERLAEFSRLSGSIKDGQAWFKARKDWFLTARHADKVWKLRRLGKQVTAFELAAARLPEPLFIAAVNLVKQGLI